MSKLIAKYKSISPAIKASIWFIIANFLQKGIALITTPIFTRMLTTEEYGMYSLYQTWYQVIYIFATLNLASGVFNKGMLKFKSDRNGFTSSLQGLSSIVTAVCLIVYLPFMNFFNNLFGLPTVVVLFMMAEILVAPALSFWSLRQRFEYKYVFLIIVTLIMSVLSPTLSFALIKIRGDAGVSRTVGVCLVTICFSLFFYIFNFIKGKKFFNKDYWLYGLKFNLPLIPHFLSTIVLSQADRIMIEKMYGKSYVAIYSVSYTLASIINLFVTGINYIFIPYTYQKVDEGDFESIRSKSKFLLVFIGVICLVPILVAPEIMAFIAPLEYAEGVWIIPPVSLSCYFIFLYTIFCNIEFAYESNFYTMVSSVIAALLNIALNFICMRWFGYMAAGFTTLACYIALSIFHYFAYLKVCKKQGIKQIYSIKFIVVFSIALIGVASLFALLYSNLRARIAILICIFCVAVYFRKRIIVYLKEFAQSRMK